MIVFLSGHSKSLQFHVDKTGFLTRKVVYQMPEATVNHIVVHFLWCSSTLHCDVLPSAYHIEAETK